MALRSTRFLPLDRSAFADSLRQSLQSPTDGNYFNTFNPKDGVILANRNFSPADQQSNPKAQLPDLQKWSDVAWLFWEMSCKGEGVGVGNLNYVFRVQIVNDNTRFIVSRALGSTSVGAWPGTAFNMDTDQGRAILGTPNGSGVAWFLINHQMQMGTRTVKSVNVFSTENGLQLAFKIGTP